jgi:hypothetical protein
MAVTKVTYTATATWTASDLASIFRSAFIDAGLMTEWYDSFLSGTVENRILQVVNDSEKTYGTVYYWFMFTTGGVFTHTASAWNAITHLPIGTQYLDFFSATTNATTSHQTLTTAASTTSATLVRYTSGINSSVHWFLFRNGTTSRAFFVPSVGFNSTSFVDQSRLLFNGMMGVSPVTSSNYALLVFYSACGSLRESYLGATSLRGNTTAATFNRIDALMTYAAVGNVSNAGANSPSNQTFPFGTAVMLPTAMTNTHSGLAADHTPVFTGPSISPYMASMPSDFGIAAYYAGTGMVAGDTLIVAAGVEEWDMLAVSVNTIASAGRAFFLARTV